jgi:putative NADPH-quinone reductase
MRNEWLAEENPGKVYQMLFNPKQYYKDLAPQFKNVEAEMEETFWSSKYVYP